MRKYVYNCLIRLLLPLLFIRLWYKGISDPGYRCRWAERLGYINAPSNSRNGICFHCVSVGEAIAAAPLIKQIQQQYPHFSVTITTTTPTGSEQVKNIFGDSVFHTYLPFDAPRAVKRFLRQIQPRLLILIETELWPNLLHFAHEYSVKILLANARLSAKSAAGYQRLKPLTGKMMDNITHIAAHNQQDGNRFIDLGLLQEKLSVTGSIKFDLSISEDLLKQSRELKSLWATINHDQQRPIWVAGSTHPGEEELILQVYKQLLATQPNLLLILVPRHQARFEHVAQLIKKHQFSFVRRTDKSAVNAETQIVLGDTMGELLLFWSIADMAFVGGSLVNHGGHNPLEPCIFNIPVVSGPNVRNF
ncbi:lipid IV(A) 3-deoxy-D-manno-octulosonic acid transferase [Paraglaciecola sp. L3A3]|uniref:lipid IV(A) 3-deoxy-D-manno-octulosonic acid transferase n=1 Tax=Paraglaciecola sp. L3A3 TaxID=2686358 RepID=UPI00131A6200|nr:lipid IV(A) 3-deoxy-D-manno-octulosonic acid transferase [Paraglaciecola sp. L3A3]